MQYCEYWNTPEHLQETPPITQPEKRSLSDLVRRFMCRRVGYRQRKRLEALEALEDLRQRFGSRAGNQAGVELDNSIGAERETDVSRRFPQ